MKKPIVPIQMVALILGIVLSIGESVSAQVTEEWVARYNGPGNGGENATALAVDPQGNVYVTGSSWGAGTDNDYTTVKYDADGHELWVARYNGPGNGWGQATALAVVPQGNVYVTGSSWGVGSDVNYAADYATIKYTQDKEKK
jgi:hypothetical protein